MEPTSEPGGIESPQPTMKRESEKIATEKDGNDINASRNATPTSNRASHEEESLEVRLERLGRERPACFKSTWQEAGFVFSIAMSQVLAVTTTPFLIPTKSANRETGIFCFGLYCYVTNYRQGIGYPSRQIHLARRSILSRRCRLLARLRTFRRYVWRVSNLRSRHGLAYCLVTYLWFLDKYGDDECL